MDSLYVSSGYFSPGILQDIYSIITLKISLAILSGTSPELHLGISLQTLSGIYLENLPVISPEIHPPMFLE